MRFKALFYRVLVASAGFSLPLFLLAAVAPSLINAEPVKKHLIEELNSWTGSRVAINGKVAIDEFFSLSLKAENVQFLGFDAMPGLKTLEAETIIARIAWIELFSGRLDFDKIKIINARAQIHNAGQADWRSMIEPAFTKLARSENHQFDAFVLEDCHFFIGGDVENTLRDFNVESFVVQFYPSTRDMGTNGTITIDQHRLSFRTVLQPDADADVPLNLTINGALLTAEFSGNAKLSEDWSASGDLALAIPEPAALADRLGFTGLKALAYPIRVAGAANITNTQLQLEGGQLSVADQDGTGAFNLTFADGRKSLAGSLGFQAIDLNAIHDPDSETKNHIDMHALKTMAVKTDIDLRISAETIRIADMELTNSAFTLFGKSGKLLADVAQVDTLGGSLLGRADFDLASERPGARLKITGQGLDAAQIQARMIEPAWLDGAINGNLVLETSGNSLREWTDNIMVTGKAAVPEGGQIRLDLDRLAAMPQRKGADNLEQSVFSWSDFDLLRFDFGVKAGTMSVNAFSMTRNSGAVKGGGRINLTEKTIDWAVTLMPGAQIETADGASGARKSFQIAGPWSNPVIRAVRSGNRAARDLGAQTVAEADANRL